MTLKDQKQIALLPLDNRPVSYLLPKQIADFSGINLILPERKYLGDLKKGADLDYIEGWCKGLINQALTLIVSLDNWAYGGLVQSRNHSFLMSDLKQRIKKIQELSLPKYGFSSIMRIANHDSSEEEKEYWKDFGKKIYNWSELMHKVGRGVEEGYSSEVGLIDRWYESSKEIPPNVLANYKSHREKNFTVNLLWLESLHENCFEYLIFSCDDSSRFGMNVVEAEYLGKEISKHNFRNKAKIISGTDEISLVLLTKAILRSMSKKPSISIFFSSTAGKNQIAKYEGSSIYMSILNQIEAVDLEVKDQRESDILLCVHVADSIQGDHVFGEKPEDTSKNVEQVKNALEKINKPFILLDLAYANGADPNLIEMLINSDISWHNCYGYAAWNTCSNSTGSALAMGINRWLAETRRSFNEKSFTKFLLSRFLDDYAYQAKIRYPQITEEEVNKKIKPFIEIFSKVLGLNDINVKCLLPWKRSFEIEVDVI